MNHIFQKVKSLLTISMLTALMVVLLITLSILRNDKDVLNPTFTAPTDATLVLEINPINVTPALLEEILFEGKGSELIEGLRKTEDDGKMESYGINPLQPITYFTYHKNGKKLQGLIMHIIDKDNWNKSINHIFGNTSYAKRVGDFGMVVQSTSFKRQELVQFIEQHKVETNKESKVAPKHLMQLSYNQDNLLVDAKINATKNKITSSAIIASIHEAKYGQLDYILGPSAFHFSTDLINKEMNDTLDNLLSTTLFKTAELTGISINYRGIAINDNNLQPDLDLILTFKNAITVNKLIQAFPNLNSFEDNHFSIGNKKYYIKNIDDRNILISAKIDASFKENKQFIGIKAIGNPKHLTKIEAGKMVLLFLKMNKIYSLAESFSTSFQAIEINSRLLNDNSFQIESTLTASNNDNALTQLIKVIASNQQ